MVKSIEDYRSDFSKFEENLVREQGLIEYYDTLEGYICIKKKDITKDILKKIESLLSLKDISYGIDRYKWIFYYFDDECILKMIGIEYL